jgi:hypothetical protein
VSGTQSNYQGPVYIAGTQGRPYRGIGTASVSIVANVTIREVGTDRQTITKHPVEYGAAITDHAYQEPPDLMLTQGYSDVGLFEGAIIDFYGALLALQASRVPFNVYTGKRVYSNMMFSSIAIQTDEKTENVLMVQASLTNIILVSLGTSVLPATASNQGSPQDNGPPVNNGQQQLQTPNTQQNTSLMAQFGGSV